MAGITVLLAIIVVVIFILLLVAGVYSLNGAVYIAKIKGYKDVDGLAKAHTILSWIGSLVVIGLILVIGGVVLLFLTGIGEALVIAGASTVMTIIFALLALICIGSGIAAIFASIYIKSTFSAQDSDKDAQNKRVAYRDAYLTAILLFVPSTLVIIFIIVYYITRSAKKKAELRKRHDIITNLGKAQAKYKQQKNLTLDVASSYDPTDNNSYVPVSAPSQMDLPVIQRSVYSPNDIMSTFAY